MKVFVGRQPIFNRSQETIGYELLYRKGQKNSYDGFNGDQTTAEVLVNTYLNMFKLRPGVWKF